MDFGVVNTALQAIVKTVNMVKNNFTNYYTNKSLADVTKLTRVEPLTIISKDCLNLEYMIDINQSLLSIFAAYYLQAVSVLTKVNDVEVVRILDKLNPDRDETGFLFEESSSISNESYRNMVTESYSYSLPTKRVIATEADDDRDKASRGDVDSKNFDRIAELSNLSVGKLLNVEISYSKKDDGGCTEDRKIKIPVAVRLIASVIPNASIIQLLASITDDTSLTERWFAWRSGRISFIRDLIFCQDLIKEAKKAIIEDETNTMQEIVRRVNNNKKYGLLTKNPSLASASNLFVISEEVARELENKLGGRLSNAKVRQRAFDNCYAMIICVVDREWERVTFYTNGINQASDFSIKELKNASKNKGPDIADIVKSLGQSMPASF